MSLLPSPGPDTSSVQEGELQVMGVDEDVEELLDALSSETARVVLNAIYEEPGTPSEIADRLDMSIQKVSYHLDKLEEEELIAIAGTRYSEKGQEMKVYEPPDEPVVLFVGTKERKHSIKRIFKRLLPTVSILAFASVLIERLYGPSGLLPSSVDLADRGGIGSGTETDAPAASATPTATDRTTEESIPTDENDGTVHTDVAETATPDGSDGNAGYGGSTETPVGTTTSTEGGGPVDGPTPSGDPVSTGTPTGTDTPTPTEIPTATDVPTATDAPNGTGTGTATDLATEVMDTATATETMDTASTTADLLASQGLLSPGVVFFVGGLFALALLVATRVVVR